MGPDCKITLYYTETDEKRQLYKIEIRRYSEVELRHLEKYYGSVYYVHELHQIKKLYWILGMIPSRYQRFLSYLNFRNNGKSTIYFDAGPYLRQLEPLVRLSEEIMCFNPEKVADPVFDHTRSLYLGCRQDYSPQDTCQLGTLKDNAKFVSWLLEQRRFFGRVIAERPSTYVRWYQRDMARYRVLSEDILIAIRFLDNLNQAINRRYNTLYYRLENEHLSIVNSQVVKERGRLHENDYILEFKIP